jgi:hypothetical protein
VQNIIGDIAAEGEYRALTALYNGQTRSNATMAQANITKREGKAGVYSALMKGGSTMLNSPSGLDWLEKYG